MRTRETRAVGICWATWPAGLIASICTWDARPALVGLVLAATATAYGLMALQVEKARTAPTETPKDA